MLSKAPFQMRVDMLLVLVYMQVLKVTYTCVEPKSSVSKLLSGMPAHASMP